MSDKNNNDKDKDYPGYPHYPPGEDITRQNEKVSPDTEGKPQTTQNAPAGNPENDINAEDLAVLEQEDRNIVATRLDNTDEDGEPLNEPTTGNPGEGLDVPGSEQDDDNEAIGEEDEENNYYSLGDNDTTEDTEGIP